MMRLAVSQCLDWHVHPRKLTTTLTWGKTSQPVIEDEVKLAGEQSSLCFCYYLVVNMSFQVRQWVNPERSAGVTQFILFGVGLQFCCWKPLHAICFVFRPQRLSAERNTSDSDSVGVSTGENGRENGEKNWAQSPDSFLERHAFNSDFIVSRDVLSSQDTPWFHTLPGCPGYFFFW